MDQVLHRVHVRRLRRREPDQESDDEDNPLGIFRAITGQTLFRHISELPEHDPLRAPMRRWVYRLAEQRINHDVLTRLTRERRLLRHPPEAPRQAGVSIEQMLKRSLSSSSIFTTRSCQPSAHITA